MVITLYFPKKEYTIGQNVRIRALASLAEQKSPVHIVSGGEANMPYKVQ